MQQLWGDGYFFPVPAAGVGPLTYSRSHAHTTRLLSIALLLQHSIIDLLTAVAHTPAGVSTLDATVPQPQRSCS